MVKCTLIVFLCSFFYLVNSANGKIELNFRDASATANPKYLDMKVTVRNETQTGQTVVDIDAILKSDLGKTLLFWIGVESQNEMSGYEKLFQTDNLEVCSTLETAKGHPLAVPFLENIKKFGNIPQSCPVAKGTYSLKGFYINGDILPSFAPSGNFRVKFGILVSTPSNSTENLFSMQWDAQIVNDAMSGMK